jgi:hypothetical protein
MITITELANSDASLDALMRESTAVWKLVCWKQRMRMGMSFASLKNRSKATGRLDRGGSRPRGLQGGTSEFGERARDFRASVKEGIWQNSSTLSKESHGRVNSFI